MNKMVAGCVFNTGIIVFIIGMGMMLFGVDVPFWIIAGGAIIMIIGYGFSPK